jgi:hypothetical protein
MMTNRGQNWHKPQKNRSVPPTDVNYMLGMLSARFLAYGLGMFYIARSPEKNIFWINNMILIQVIDLTVGLFYTLNGTIGLAVSAFPMVNATVFIVLLWLWRPKTATSESLGQ